jgi:hypothetical protein
MVLLKTIVQVTVRPMSYLIPEDFMDGTRVGIANLAMISFTPVRR